METRGETPRNSIIVVPSVQEMVKEKVIKTVPPRYVRSDLDQSEVTDGSAGLSSEIPIIDMKRLCSATTMDSGVEKLDYACKEWGFFQLVNHGIEPSLLEKIKSEIQDFFNLPMQEKNKFWQTPNEMEGFGQIFVVSDDQKLDWGDIFALVMQPVQLRKPHLFPKLPLPFRDLLEVYSSQVKSISKILITKIAKALEIRPEEIEEMFGDDIFQTMRMNYYPPCPEPDKVIGITPHSDATGLTILLQVNEVEGLQIKKDGKWVFVKPLPNAFIVNIGDILEIITNGAYRSIEHRAVVNSEKERLSIATFHRPELNTKFGPSKSLVERQKVAKFRSITTKDYLKVFFSRELYELVNHGIDQSLLDKLKLEIQDFFNLPMEEKKKLWQQPNEMEGFGQAFVVSEDQKLDWGDVFYLVMQPVELRKPHLFPKLPLPFRDTLEMYSAQSKSITNVLIAKMGKALQIKPEEIEEMFGDELFQTLRMNYYPPCPEPDQVIGLTPHSDATGLTILFEVNEVEGLKIKKDGKWVFIKPLPNAFIVNIGDILEIITNGTYRSIEHQALVNPDSERLAITAFHLPGLNTKFGPAKSLVERQKAAKFRSLTTKDYVEGYFSRELYAESYLDVMRL